MNLINDRAESNAKRRVNGVQNGIDANGKPTYSQQGYEQMYDMHTVGKHGPEVSDAALKQRAIDGTNPQTGRTPNPPRPNPSSQFNDWRTQMNAINDALSREARGLSKYTGVDTSPSKNPIVTGNMNNGYGRSYRPNNKDKYNPKLNILHRYELKFRTDGTPFTGYPKK